VGQDPDSDSESPEEYGQEDEQWYGNDGRPLFGKRLDFNAGNQSIEGMSLCLVECSVFHVILCSLLAYFRTELILVIYLFIYFISFSFFFV
jgi:hypothetical protein